ncbi:tRNA (N(6)-L-threonylcarbamoyladenosine(37)-C(2))-methylthiotransferase MtaB [bacterium]|nr:tRNA (N(6)-L-threonylcarbamoyladenosine(37)-C(2))-methylthiotransferase MtaB [bacterium]
MPAVLFKTLGCKLNQAETALMVEAFLHHGYTVTGSESQAQVAVINTCTVTGRSDAKCRQAIRHVLTANPGATVIVTGCYSQVAAQEIASIPGVDYILGIQEKLEIFRHFPGPGKKDGPVVAVNPVQNLQKEKIAGAGDFQTQTRAILKIQNGCDNRCAYCIVPVARGPGRSIPLDTVLDHARQLADRGYREIVLTGVHVGAYGKDMQPAGLLPDLLEAMTKISGLLRIRLTSLEPEDVSDRLLDVIAHHEQICRHFHLSVQSASRDVLKAMKRRSGLSGIEATLGRILKKFAGPGLGADIITGFPGESDSHFHETRDFLAATPFTYFHVFPFSARNGTPAAAFTGQVPVRIRMERAADLRMLGHEKALAFRGSWLNRHVRVLLEGRNHNGRMSGWTSEYIRVSVPFRSDLINRLVSVKTLDLDGKGIRGEVQD